MNLFSCYNVIVRRDYGNKQMGGCVLMFNVKDAVFYGVHGVCIIEEISKKEIFGSVNDYYTLKPVYSSKTKVFVPVDRADKTVNLRKVITKDKALQIIEQLKTSDSMWIDDDAVRKKSFAEILKNGQVKELAWLIKTIYEKRIELGQEKKKMHAADERILADAERSFNEELAFVLDIEKDKVPEYISEKLGIS